MENRHEVVSIKPQEMSEPDIASRIKLKRRSCTKQIDFSKYAPDDLDYTDSDIDPDFESPVLLPKKPKVTFNKLKHKKRKYKKLQKHTSGVIDLSKGADVYKGTIIDLTKTEHNNNNGNYGFLQLNASSNKKSQTKTKKETISIDSSNSDTVSLPSPKNYLDFESDKENQLLHPNVTLFSKYSNSSGKISSPQSPISTEKGTISNFETEDLKEKIPRPPNAFMIFANEWRKHLAKFYPRECNKTISIRLGQHWRILSEKNKQIYYRRAKISDSEHKKKYPDYQYNPKEARIRKAQRDALKVAQRQAASSVSLLQSPAYSPLSSTSRLDMNSTSPMQQFIPAYSSQQTLGQNVGSISGGGIINAGGVPPPLGSRPSPIILSNSTSRRPPPPAYPGLTRQPSFHHGLEPNHREYGMGYGEPGFNPLSNMYSNNQNISSPTESHASGMFDSQYPNNTPMETGMWNGVPHNVNMWNQQNFEMQRQHPINDYSPFQSPEQHPRNQLIPATSTPTPGNNLDDPNMFHHSDFPSDGYNYPKNQHPLNILTPKDLNRSIKTENHIDNSIEHTKPDLSASQRMIEQYPPRTNTPMPSLPYNPNLYKHETISHVASSYHPKMSPKPHIDETRMSPYNRPNHSPKNTSKDLIHYRISPKIFDNKMSASPKSQKSPKSHKHGNTSPPSSALKFDRKSPKAQMNGVGHTPEVKREPSPEKHPLPAFSKAFSGTERGRLLATPENTNLNLVGGTSDTSDSLTVPNNPDFEFLNIDLFNEENSKINFDEMNELNHNFSDTI